MIFQLQGHGETKSQIMLEKTFTITETYSDRIESKLKILNLIQL